MSSNNTSSSIGFTSLLLLTFIILKLVGVIDWSWWWVLSPVWITVGISIILFGIYAWFKYRELKEKNNRTNVLNNGLKSKWQERLEQMQEARKKAQTLRDNK